MIEQESQNQETVVEPPPPPAPAQTFSKAEEPELFNHYEIKSWKFSPTIYKIFAGSAIFNVLALLIVGQSHLLTQKGCDSPLVSQVCQVIDIVYVGGKMMNTETSFVNEPWENERLGEDVDITYVDVSSQRPLDYPEGYFALANPEEFARRQQEQLMMENGGMPGIPGQSPIFIMPPSGSISTIPSPGSGTDMLGAPPVLPPSNPGAVTGPALNSPLGGFPGSTIPRPPRIPRTRPTGPVFPRGPKMKNEADKQLPELDGEKTAGVTKPEKTPEPDKEPANDPSKPITEIKLNRGPLDALGKTVSDLVKDKKVNLQTEFKVGAVGRLKDDGEFDPKSFKYTEASSPDTSANGEQMVEVVRESIEAINKSGYFKYLQALSGKDLNLLIQQDSTNLTGVVSSEVESKNRAESLKKTLDLAISLVKLKKTVADASDNDKDDLALLNNASVKVEGKRIVITFAVPKDIAKGLIDRKLLNQVNDPNKPNATALIKDKNSNASR